MSKTMHEHAPSWARRHRALLAALGIVLGTAASVAIKEMSEAKATPVEIPAADAIGLRQDIGYLREDIREERRSRESLTTQMGEFNGRLRALERQADAKAAK
jgi:hypothetical protein